MLSNTAIAQLRNMTPTIKSHNTIQDVFTIQ